MELLIRNEKSINSISQEVHKNAKAHGWWEHPPREGELLILVISEVV